MPELSPTLADRDVPPPLLACPRCGSNYSSQTHRCGIDGEPLVSPDQDFLIGRTLDRYRILERIGVGAMGCVYRAVHVELDNVVAIKVLLGELGADQRFVARFRREAQILHRTAHPNVVRVLDFGRSAEGLPYMVMELVEGHTLESAIASGAPFSPAKVRALTGSILAGLGAIHAAGIVHRDVKPANVMIGATVKLLDFGIAGTLGTNFNETKLTAIGKILGTPTYMAPEQAEGAEVTAAADLYSVGAIMFEMLTGAPPFNGHSFGEILIKHATEPPPPLPPSEGLALLVEALLAKRPADRPATAQAVIEALTPTVREALQVRTAPATRRRRWPIALATGAGSLAIALAIGTRSEAPLPPPVPIAVTPTEAAPIVSAPIDPPVLIIEPPVAEEPKVEPSIRARSSRIEEVPTAVLRAKLDRTLRALQGASTRLPPAKLATLEERALAAGEEVSRPTTAQRSIELAKEITAIERELSR